MKISVTSNTQLRPQNRPLALEGNFLQDIFEAFVHSPKESSVEANKSSTTSLSACKSDLEIANIFFTVFNIPEKNRTDIKAKIPLASDNKSFLGMERVLNAYNEIPVAEKVSVIANSMFCLKGENGHQIEKILKAITKIPLNIRSDIAIARPIIGGARLKKSKQGLGIAKILQAIAAIPMKTWADFTEEISSLLKGKATHEIEKILQAIAEIPQYKQFSVLSKAISIIEEARPKKNKTGDAIARIIKAINATQLITVTDHYNLFLIDKRIDKIAKNLEIIAAISPEKQPDLPIKAKPLLEVAFTYRHTHYMPEILNPLATIPEEERPDLLIKAKPLLEIAVKNSYEYHIPKILAVLLAIPTGEQANFLAMARTFFEDMEYGDTTLEILQAIAAIPMEARADVLAKANPLVKVAIQYGYTHHIPTILEVLATTPPEEWTDFLSMACPFFENTRYRNAILEISKAPAPSPPEEQTDSLSMAGPFLDNTKYRNATSEILKAIAAISKKSQSNSFLMINPLLTVKEYKDRIRKALATIPVDTVDDFLAIIHPLLKNANGTIQNLEEMLNILESTVTIPIEAQADFITILTRFSGCGVKKMLATATAVPREEQADVFANTLLILECGTSYGIDQEKIMLFVTTIPRGKRKDILVKAKPFLKIIDCSLQKAKLLKVLATIQEEADFLAKYDLLLEDALEHKYGNSAPAILKAAQAIPLKEWADFLAMLRPFLTNGSSEDKEELLEALLAIPMNQRAEAIAKARQEKSIFPSDHPIHIAKILRRYKSKNSQL